MTIEQQNELVILRRQIATTRIVGGLAITALGMLVFARTIDKPAPDRIEMSKGHARVSMDAQQLQVGNATVDSTGLRSAVLTGSDQNSLVSLTAQPTSATLALEYDGRGLRSRVDGRSTIVFDVHGPVRSELSVNVETGEWLLTRTRVEGKEIVKTDKIVVVPVL